MPMDGWAEDADWAPLAEGIAEAVSGLRPRQSLVGFRSMCVPLSMLTE